MKVKYSVQNVHCQKCANTIVNSLSSEFDDIEVLLEKEPKEIIISLKDKKQEEAFIKEMDEIGFPIIEEISRS